MNTRIIPSLIHMQLNRLLRVAPRYQESVIYYCLKEIYHSQIVRSQ